MGISTFCVILRKGTHFPSYSSRTVHRHCPCTHPNAFKPMNLYFYLDAQNQQHGPISVARFAECGVSASTLVWCNGMDNWTPASAVPELREWFDQHQSAQETPAQEETEDTRSQAYAPGQGADSTSRAQGAGTAYGHFSGPSNGGYGPQYNGAYIPCPPTYLVWAILSTLCCCLPLGIVAIVKSCQVSSAYAHGNYDAALIASDDARRWCLYTFMAALLIHFLRIVWGLVWGTSLGFLGLLTNWGM